MVLGKSPAMPDADGANSGYLIGHGRFTALLDCGSGVFSKLRALSDPARVDAVLISHMHADHMFDLFPFGHALLYHGGERPRRLPLWLPPGGLEVLDTIDRALCLEGEFRRAFDAAEYDPAAGLELGPLHASFRAIPHYVPTWACDLRAPDGRRFTFGADCAPNDAVVELATGTDLLMLEATLGTQEQQGSGLRGHMNAREAGELGRRAGARKLLLTHYSDSLDTAALRATAQESFGAVVELTAQGEHYKL